MVSGNRITKPGLCTPSIQFNVLFISLLFQDLIAKLVFKRPEKPIDFLVKEMEELKREGTRKSNKDDTAY